MAADVRESEMTDEPHLPRFLVRRGARRGWMVWDRHTKGPAKYLGYPVVELPEDKAREIADVLTRSADTSLKVSGQWWPRT
jgi:hypothetical protein